MTGAQGSQGAEFAEEGASQRQTLEICRDAPHVGLAIDLQCERKWPKARERVTRKGVGRIISEVCTELETCAPTSQT